MSRRELFSFVHDMDPETNHALPGGFFYPARPIGKGLGGNGPAGQAIKDR